MYFLGDVLSILKINNEISGLTEVEIEFLRKNFQDKDLNRQFLEYIFNEDFKDIFLKTKI